MTAKERATLRRLELENQQLREKVRASMERDASTDAAAQVAKDDDDAAEMRDMYRARNAA